MFTTFGGFLRFSWNAWNGGFTTGNPHANWGLPEQISAQVQQVESYFGFEFAAISSGYRSPCGNANLIPNPGPPQSLHMQGRAADLKIPDPRNTELVRDSVVKHVREVLGGWSYKYGNGYIHVQW